MSSASSSTVTAYNARRHAVPTPTQSSTRTGATRSRPSPSSVSGESAAHSFSASGRSPGSISGTVTPRPGGGNGGAGDVNKRSQVPITPAVLRDIFANSRTLIEERTISRVAFFRFAGFLLSCLGISLAAARGRPVAGLGLNR